MQVYKAIIHGIFSFEEEIHMQSVDCMHIAGLSIVNTCIYVCYIHIPKALCPIVRYSISLCDTLLPDGYSFSVTVYYRYSLAARLYVYTSRQIFFYPLCNFWPHSSLPAFSLVIHFQYNVQTVIILYLAIQSNMPIIYRDFLIEVRFDFIYIIFMIQIFDHMFIRKIIYNNERKIYSVRRQNENCIINVHRSEFLLPL